MSYFGAKLEELLERNKLTAAELSRASGLKDGLISRWITGSQDFVSHEALEAITAVISKKPAEQAELIKAHLLDECVGQGASLIEINILGHAGQVKEASTPYSVVPSLRIQRALEIMARESVTDADVRNLILSTGDLLARFNSNAADPASAVILAAAADVHADATSAEPSPAHPPKPVTYRRTSAPKPASKRST